MSSKKHSIEEKEEDSHQKPAKNEKIDTASKFKYYTLWFDGGCDGNGTKLQSAGCGYVIYGHNTPENNKEKKLIEGYTYIGFGTNNVAEYTGLLEGLKQAKYDLGAEHLTCIGDSQLVINHLNGSYKCKSPNLKDHYNEACTYKSLIKTLVFKHVLRDQNKEADALATLGKDTKRKEIKHFY